MESARKSVPIVLWLCRMLSFFRKEILRVRLLDHPLERIDLWQACGCDFRTAIRDVVQQECCRGCTPDLWRSLEGAEVEGWGPGQFE